MPTALSLLPRLPARFRTSLLAPRTPLPTLWRLRTLLLLPASPSHWTLLPASPSHPTLMTAPPRLWTLSAAITVPPDTPVNRMTSPDASACLTEFPDAFAGFTMFTTPLGPLPRRLRFVPHERSLFQFCSRFRSCRSSFFGFPCRCPLSDGFFLSFRSFFELLCSSRRAFS